MTAPNTVENFHGQWLPEPNSGCWLWIGYSPNGRYGSIKWNGTRKLAHVLSYELHKGPIPEGKILDHLCHNTYCVNPAHLEPVTQLINMRRSSFATKTHCVHGHPYNDGFEYYIRPDTGTRYRRCLTCYRLRYRTSK